jgi:2-phospho-L-lactate guanylyltransferase
MTLWAIVPVKPLKQAKSRLSEVLSKEQGALLSRELLDNTLRTLASIPEVERTLVISRDSAVLAMARDLGAKTLAERASPELDGALVRATVVAQGYNVSSVLILPADLPFLSVEDLRHLIERSSPPPVVVIVPDRHGRGTNALLIRPPGLIAFDSGPESFHTHVERARRAGARIEVCDLPGLALDLDKPEDLQLYRERNAKRPDPREQRE